MLSFSFFFCFLIDTAVVAAAKSRGGGTLQPMTAAQIAALSQVQAQAIVHARKASQQQSNANTNAGGGGGGNTTPAQTEQTPQQLQRQIQLQAQALVHAHTQAQIQAGIYKGTGEDAAATGNTSETGTGSVAASASTTTTSASAKLPPPRPAAAMGTQQQQQQQTSSSFTSDPLGTAAPSSAASSVAAMTNNAMGMPASVHHLASQAPGVAHPANMVQQQQQGSSLAMVPVGSASASSSMMSMMEQDIPAPSSTSPQFLAQLHSSLNAFWQQSLREIRQLENQTEQDFKNHNDLPLARIKRIMKSDEDVRMISAEAPVLFAKACELFILDLSIRSWNFSQLHKRRTLQKEDVKEAIQKTDIFDFLVDVIQ
jgi:nuclear transcription factor Y, gamma